jgi:glycosyltransferase involved in cell wall biosynthesis
MVDTVAVVVCAYSPDRWGPLQEAVASLHEQSFDGEVRVVIVVDGDEQLCKLATNEYSPAEDVLVHCNEANVGVSTSRNNGVNRLDDDVDVVAFIDDDAVARPDWIAQLVETYEETSAVAVGGRMVAEWVNWEPRFLPEEHYWLVGVNGRNLADPGEMVRNTFASNMSFRYEVFRELGGFADSIGRRDDANLQAEEPELGARLQAKYGRGMVYNPDAVVAHKIFPYRLRFQWLADRAFWQGYSKRAIKSLTPETSAGAESAFLRHLLLVAAPRRLWKLVRKPSVTAAGQLGMLLIITAIVGVGYLYGFAKYG